MSQISDEISDHIWQEAARYAVKSHSNPCFPYITYIHCLLLYSVKRPLIDNGMYSIVQNSYANTIRKVANMTGNINMDINTMADLFYKGIDNLNRNQPNLHLRLDVTGELYVASAFDNPGHNLRFPMEEEVYLFMRALDNVADYIQATLPSYTPTRSAAPVQQTKPPAPAPVWNTKPHYAAPPKKTMDNPPMDEGHALTLLICTISAIIGAAAYFILH